MPKSTLVLGASENVERYSNMAVKLLQQFSHPVIAVGNKIGTVNEIAIQKGQPIIENLDTITLYLNPINQQPYYKYILGLNPKRIIFNPGTENQELQALAKAQGIETQEACTLVLLRTGQY